MSQYFLTSNIIIIIINIIIFNVIRYPLGSNVNTVIVSLQLYNNSKNENMRFIKCHDSNRVTFINS